MHSRKVISMASSTTSASIPATSSRVHDESIGETLVRRPRRTALKPKIFSYSFVWLVLFCASQLNCLEGRPSSLFQEATVTGYQQFSQRQRQPQQQQQPHSNSQEEHETNFASASPSLAHPHAATSPLPGRISVESTSTDKRKNVTEEGTINQERSSKGDVDFTELYGHFHPARILQINPVYAGKGRRRSSVHPAGQLQAQPRKLDFEPEIQDENDMQAFPFQHPPFEQSIQQQLQNIKHNIRLVTTSSPSTPQRHFYRTDSDSLTTNPSTTTTTSTSTSTTPGSTPTTTTGTTTSSTTVSLTEENQNTRKKLKQKASVGLTDGKVTENEKSYADWITTLRNALFNMGASLSLSTVEVNTANTESEAATRLVRHGNSEKSQGNFDNKEEAEGGSKSFVHLISSIFPLYPAYKDRAAIIKRLGWGDNGDSDGKRLSADHLSVFDSNNSAPKENVNVNPIHFSHSTSNDGSNTFYNIISPFRSPPSPNQNQNQNQTHPAQSSKIITAPWPNSTLSPRNSSKDGASNAPLLVSSAVSLKTPPTTSPNQSQGYSESMKVGSIETDTKEKEEDKVEQPQTLPVLIKTMAAEVLSRFMGAKPSPAPTSTHTIATTTTKSIPTTTLKPNMNLNGNSEDKLLPVAPNFDSDSYSTLDLNGNLFETRTPPTPKDISSLHTITTNDTLQESERRDQPLAQLPPDLLTLVASIFQGSSAPEHPGKNPNYDRMSPSPLTSTSNLTSPLLQHHNDTTTRNAESIMANQIDEPELGGKKKEKGHTSELSEQLQSPPKQKTSEEMKKRVESGQVQENMIESTDSNHHGEKANADKDEDEDSAGWSLADLFGIDSEEDDSDARMSILGPGPSCAVVGIGIGLALYVYGRTWRYVIPNAQAFTSTASPPIIGNLQNLGSVGNLFSELLGGGAPGATGYDTGRSYDATLTSKNNGYWYPPDYNGNNNQYSIPKYTDQNQPNQFGSASVIQAVSPNNQMNYVQSMSRDMQFEATVESPGESYTYFEYLPNFPAQTLTFSSKK